MMSKMVTREQGLSFGGRMMRGEELYTAVTKVWHNKSNLPALARPYAGHHQIVCSVLEHEGGGRLFAGEEGNVVWYTEDIYDDGG